MNAALWSEVEDGVVAVVDKLGVLELVLANIVDGRLSPEQIRATTRLVGEAACEARAIEVDLIVYRTVEADPAAGLDAALLAGKLEVDALRTVITTLGARTAAVGIAEQHGGAAPDVRATAVSLQAARDLLAEVRADIATMQARTIAGLCFKAGLVKPEIGDDEASRKLTASILSDLLALGGRRV